MNRLTSDESGFEIYCNKGTSGQSPEVLSELASLVLSRGKPRGIKLISAPRLGNAKALLLRFSRSTSLIKLRKGITLTGAVRYCRI